MSSAGWDTVPISLGMIGFSVHYTRHDFWWKAWVSFSLARLHCEHIVHVCQKSSNTVYHKISWGRNFCEWKASCKNFFYQMLIYYQHLYLATQQRINPFYRRNIEQTAEIYHKTSTLNLAFHHRHYKWILRISNPTILLCYHRFTKLKFTKFFPAAFVGKSQTLMLPKISVSRFKSFTKI